MDQYAPRGQPVRPLVWASRAREIDETSAPLEGLGARVHALASMGVLKTLLGAVCTRTVCAAYAYPLRTTTHPAPAPSAGWGTVLTPRRENEVRQIRWNVRGWVTTVYNTYLGLGDSQYFDLYWTVDNNVVVLTLARDGSAPPVPPTGCCIGEYALYFHATCNAQQPPGVSQITIMETHLGWLGGVDAYENSAWTVENANGQPYADINAWEFGPTYPTLYLSACNENQWGQKCVPQPTELPNPDDPSNFPTPHEPTPPPPPHPPLKPIHPPAP